MITQAAVPGAFLVDMLPFRMCFLLCPIYVVDMLLVKHLPAWTPLTQDFRKYGAKGRQMVQDLITKPFEIVKNNIVGHTHSDFIWCNNSITRGRVKHDLHSLVMPSLPMKKFR